MKENEINIEDRISLARRTMYALMNTGLHGTNGMNPLAAIKMYEAYVIPKLLYGVEILPLNATQTNCLSTSVCIVVLLHDKMLCRKLNCRL
jgi:hypothetical protein